MGERRGTKALELWCRRMVEGYKNVRVDNMTTSWRDGLAFCALVSKCSSLKQMPDLMHFDELKKENVYHNNELAFRVAEEYLGIPALLDPQDMADYEVPDKLSILTYLSQFYQVFGAQENSLRLKRSSTSEANKSSSSTPPAKMAHVVPRREPCVKCNNPVFFAERLVINEGLYHRTCFRCARCSSVLTLGNFYETEKDHEFCCETCPDEEKTTTKVEGANRLSIAQKIALFERESSSVLKKSLSDEEKSKSLSRQKPANSEAFNSFLTTQVNPQEPEVSEGDEKTNESLSSDSDSEDDEQGAPPPEIKLNTMPSISDKKAELSEHKIISESPEHFVVTKELTHDKDTQAIAKPAETHPESHVFSDSAHVTNFLTELDALPHDDIELEFERLAEDAVKSPIAPIPVVSRKTPLPEIKKIVEEVQEEPQQLLKLDEKVQEPHHLLKLNEKEEELEPISKPEVEEPQLVQSIPVAVEEIEKFVEVNEKEKPVEIASKEQEVKVQVAEEIPEIKQPEIVVEPSTPDVIQEESYPDNLDPFGEDEEPSKEESKSVAPKKLSLNPFGSSEDEDDNQEIKRSPGTLPKPPRPPPPKTIAKPSSTNPFGSDDEDEAPEKLQIRTPVPTPRKPFLHSATPEPSPRSLSSHNSPGHSFKGSTSSLASSTDGMSLRRRKKKAPAPPPPVVANSNEALGTKTPSATPKKKRPAPTPPSSTPKLPSNFQEPPAATSFYVTATDSVPNETESNLEATISSIDNESLVSQPGRRLIPLEESLIEEGSSVKQPLSEEPVTYRRKIVPLSPTVEDKSFENVGNTKDNKEAQNRQRQSQNSLMSNKTASESNDSLPYLNKSSHGKWKRRKGPAPALPGYAEPQRRVLQMLPLQEIRRELEVIEVQQQGLEKQGVMLEKMIRERCEGSADNRTTEELLQSLPDTKNPKEVEELILQLFELVNEKNELFRRQAELMYLRRAHRLEEEQADVEYEIRTLMAQPEQNKTDSDKTKEEALIARLVEIVQLRNEVVDTLDRDRLREAEEDLSIKQRMESHTAKLDQDYLNQTPTKLSKKEKKKLKEAKKLKNKKLDADKDLDTSEMKSESSEKKKKKKKFLF